MPPPETQIRTQVDAKIDMMRSAYAASTHHEDCADFMHDSVCGTPSISLLQLLQFVLQLLPQLIFMCSHRNPNSIPPEVCARRRFLQKCCAMCCVAATPVLSTMQDRWGTHVATLALASLRTLTYHADAGDACGSGPELGEGCQGRCNREQVSFRARIAL